MDNRKCILCGQPALFKVDNNDLITFYCHNCSCYSISQTLFEDIKHEHINRSILSGYVREKYEETQTPVCLTTDNFREIFNSPLIPHSVPEKLSKFILYLYKKTESFGQPIKLCSSVHNCPQAEGSQNPAVCYAKNTAELFSLRKAMLAEGYTSETGGLGLTLRGHNKAEELLAKSSIDSQKAFVAMWFSNEMQEVYGKAIEPAIRECGFQACRVDKIEHNNDITDEIISGIKESRFVIADMTGYRGGVYYEAGYAKGLGKEVIITCRSDWFDGAKDGSGNTVKEKIHFDINHINIIKWDSIEDLKKRLIHRIAATIL